MYEIELTPSATKQYKNLPNSIIDRITDAIDVLEKDPRPAGFKKLKGEEAYRIRVGDYRVVYEIHDNILQILVIRIMHRKKVYKKTL
jgi:mRNA interferase RelE/StbE